MNDICFASASEIAYRIRRREISAEEVLNAHLAQIERVNGTVNAIVTLVPDLALARARDIDKLLAAGEDPGVLAGLPIAHKDLVATKGIRTTRGSRVFKDHIPDEDAMIVRRLKAAGVVTLGKTNVPEFGAGSQTFNEVFGATRNPYNTDRTCGGSSGGAAVALASGMIPIADGSDMGGSLRNPANFCNVVGFRPSPGRVPDTPGAMTLPLSVQGPMARTVSDVALMLSAIAGPDSRFPTSINEPGSQFLLPLDTETRGLKIAYAPDFGGLPVDKAVRDVIASSVSHFEAMGCIVEPACPDLSAADEIFKTLRAWVFANGFRDLIEQHRSLFKDTIIWNVEQGLNLSGADVHRAEQLRSTLFQSVGTFMQAYDFIIGPVSQVPPFDITVPYVTEIDGEKMQTYIDWMKSCYLISATSLPAISVPCGFTPDGLPVGLQIVGRYRDELSVLQLANAFESANPTYRRRPDIAGGSSNER